MNFICKLITGIVAAMIVYFIWRKTIYQSKDEVKKQENLKKIEDYITDKNRFTNDELQNILGVSDTTIGRYLDELESENKIIQVGKTGKFVYYTKR